MSKLLYEDITGKIIGCAMRVHSSLGNGFQEVVRHVYLETGVKSSQ